MFRNVLLLVSTFVLQESAKANETIQLGPRPFFLIDRMTDGEVKTKLLSCVNGPFERTLFSIGHRGAPLQFPEHTVESYKAAAKMGAGIMECDVTFTSDKELVCRHAQNDLHTTTNILTTDIAKSCTMPFSPAKDNAAATAECRTSDITLAEYRMLNGKMDAANRSAKTVDEYLDGTSGWRTDLYSESKGTLVTHKESIALFKSLGTKFTPELKKPSVDMPFQGFSQKDYAQKLINEYKEAGIPPSDVWPQSFNLDDILYWIDNEPEFGRQAVFLDGSYAIRGWSPNNPESWLHQMAELKAMGVNYIAPPVWALITADKGEIVPSVYALEAKKAGLNIITWTLERSGPLNNGGGWYYQSIKDLTNNDGVVFEVLDVLANDIGVSGVFSDWPATVTYYANCLGLR